MSKLTLPLRLWKQEVLLWVSLMFLHRRRGCLRSREFCHGELSVVSPGSWLYITVCSGWRNYNPEHGSPTSSLSDKKHHTMDFVKGSVLQEFNSLTNINENIHLQMWKTVALESHTPSKLNINKLVIFFFSVSYKRYTGTLQLYTRQCNFVFCLSKNKSQQ